MGHRQPRGKAAAINLDLTLSAGRPDATAGGGRGPYALIPPRARWAGASRGVATTLGPVLQSHGLTFWSLNLDLSALAGSFARWTREGKGEVSGGR